MIKAGVHLLGTIRLFISQEVLQRPKSKKIGSGHIGAIQWVRGNIKVRSRKTFFRLIWRMRLCVMEQGYKLTLFRCTTAVVVVRTIFAGNMSQLATINIRGYLVYSFPTAHSGKQQKHSRKCREGSSGLTSSPMAAAWSREVSIKIQFSLLSTSQR